MKNHTDIEQSKKLIGFLPFESADKVHHGIHLGIDGEYHLSGDNTENDVIAIDKEAYNRIFGSEICNQLPCWSLTALLNIIPKYLKDYNVLRIDIDANTFSIWYDKVGCGVNTKLPDITMEEPIEACYEMVLKLHELNLL